MTIIYTRISYHREKIISLEGLKQNKSDIKCSILLSMCVEGHVKLVIFKYDQSECVRTLDCNRWVCRAFTFWNKALFLSHKGQF